MNKIQKYFDFWGWIMYKWIATEIEFKENISASSNNIVTDGRPTEIFSYNQFTFSYNSLIEWSTPWF